MEKQLENLFSLIESEKPESEIISWIDSQENATKIYDWFNNFVQGYVAPITEGQK